MRNKSLMIAVLAVVIIGAALGGPKILDGISGLGGVTTAPIEPTVLGESELAEVSKVVDGDTIRVRTAAGTQRVRIIGINTPELDHEGGEDDCYAQEATDLLKRVIGNRSVELRADPSQGDTDRYGRLLRHVYVDGRSAALLLITAGAGLEYTYDQPYKGQSEYRAAEQHAQAAGTGLWARCSY